METTTRENGVYFDHNGNRFAEKTAWAGADDALLVWDRNKNGQIDDGSELFGNNYILQDGTKAANSFEALKEFDSNGDGVVDVWDERWSELQLWQDKNANGIVDDGELLTMEDAGVAGINTGYETGSYVDENGNEHRQTGGFIRDDGTVGDMADGIDTKYLDEVEVSEDIKLLPNAKGWGEVPSLHQAMMNDETGELRALMERFVSADPIEAKTLIWDILFVWTGTADVDPAGRNHSGLDIIDGRKLAVLEKLWGEKYYPRGCSADAHHLVAVVDAPALWQSINDWEKRFPSYMMLSAKYNDLYGMAAKAAAGYESDGDVHMFDSFLAAVRERYAAGHEERAVLHDFFSQLRVYDGKGIFADGVMRDLFDGLGASNDEFDKFLHLMWGELKQGGEANDTLVAGTGGAILHGLGGADTLYGNAGHDMLYGGDGDDNLYGGAGNDILHGGAGNDRLEGGAGDDVYLFGRGDGHDVVIETETRAGRRNAIRLGEGIGADDIELQLACTSDYYTSLVVRIKDTGETITVSSNFHHNAGNTANGYSIQAIEFADGTVWEWDDILRQPLHMTDESRIIYGGYHQGVAAVEGGSTIVGTSEADWIFGRNNDDILYGGGGDDVLLGQDGDDVLWGGAGNDMLQGGEGNDTYLFNLGDGQDSILESSGDDSLLFGDGIGSADLWFSRSGNHLVIDVLGTEDKVTIQNWYAHDAYKVETISVGGMALAHTQMEQLIQALAGFGVPQGVDGQWTDEQKEGVNAVVSSYWRPCDAARPPDCSGG